MATVPVFHPKTPFLGLIPEAVREGFKLTIRGRLNRLVGMFNIYLQTGAALGPRDDVPFHMSIRPGQQTLVRNSYRNGHWEREERQGLCSIMAGNPFELEVLVEVDCFKVKINSQVFCRFAHRYPPSSIKFVHIEDGASIDSITWEFMKKQQTISVSNPMIPFLGSIPCSVSEGFKLKIRGQLNYNVEMFNINLQTGPSVKPRDNAPLHISVRPRIRTLVRNTLRNGCWEQEERSGICPIVVGKPFELDIEVRSGYYQLKIDGIIFCTFSHRYPVATVRFLDIGAGAKITAVTYTF